MTATGNIYGPGIVKFDNLLPPENEIMMFEEYENKKRKQISLMRSLLDYGMGVLIILAGIFFFFRAKFDIGDFNENYPPDTIDKVFGGICILYGLWRVYRGYKKNYFKR